MKKICNWLILGRWYCQNKWKGKIIISAGHPHIPEGTGRIEDWKKFGAILFGVDSKLADTMDSVSRILLECAYEAIADSEKNPRHRKGEKCAVFAGCSISEAEINISFKIAMKVRYAHP